MMTPFESGGSALPVADINTHGAYGMSMRDYFAAKALQGLLANTQISKDMVKLQIRPEENSTWHAETCYAFADAMLKARQS